MITFRKADHNDIDKIAEIYDEITLMKSRAL